MRTLALLAVAAAAWCQTFTVQPQIARQGDTIRVRTGSAAATARMAGRTVRLFPQAEGGKLGLMPVPAEQRPGNYKLEFLDDKNTVLHVESVTVRDARFPKQNVVMARTTAALKPSPGEIETADAFEQAVSETRYWKEPLIEPVLGCMTARFGVRRFRNGKPTKNFHGGVDLRSPMESPVRATADGTVRLVRMFNLHGGTVGIDHGQGLESMYLHLSRFVVKEGAFVRQGDVIAYSGSTGRSAAPHLHWALVVNGVTVNPQQWVPLKPCPVARAKPKRKRR